MMTIALLLALTLGCDNDAAELRNDARDAQVSANKKIADVQTDANQEARELQAAADKKIAAAEADFLRMREDYRHAKTEALIALDVEIAALEATAMKANGADKSARMASIDAIKARRAAFLTDYAALDSATSSSWDATKARLDAGWERIDG